VTAPAPQVFNLTVGSLNAQISEPAVSPDGSQVAFVASRDGARSIWLRRLDTLEPHPIKGTDDGRFGFWSPDGTSLGFFAAGKLKTVDLASGKVEIICDAPLGFGGAWGPDGTILFSPDEHAPIFRVSAQGGVPTQVTTLDPSRHDQAHRWPDFLSDGRHFVFMPWTDGSTTRAIQVASVDGSTPPHTVVEAESGARVAGDYLFFALDRPTRIMAVAFDQTTLQVRGRPFQAVPDENFNYFWMIGYPAMSIARNGTLTYVTGKYPQTQLEWVDRAGRPLQTLGEAAPYFDPAVSPDGEHLAVEKHDPLRGSGDVWTVDVARGAFSRLTSAPGFESEAVWSPDGRRVAYASDQGVRPMIYVKNASGTGTEEMLDSGGSRAFPMDWSRDGRYILFNTRGGDTRWDIWSYDFERREATPRVASAFNETGGAFSPDGKWVAFASDASQDFQVYIQSSADASVQLQVSTRGGVQPHWRRDGKELYYVAPDSTIMAAAIDAQTGTIRAAAPQPLFTANIDQTSTLRNQYAVSADGQRFLLLSLVNRHPLPIVVVLNWANAHK
jgi:eukaryotic-like serine/threonine-protein kinase